MAASDRKDLLVSGWIRQHYEIPQDIIILIHMFSKDGSYKLIQNEKFQQIFKRIYESRNRLDWYYSHIPGNFSILEIDSWASRVEGIPIICSIVMNTEDVQVMLELKIDDSIIDIITNEIGLTLLVTTETNIYATITSTFDVDFGNASTDLNQSEVLITIPASDGIIDEYDKLDMLFSFELEWKYFQMKVKNVLQ